MASVNARSVLTYSDGGFEDQGLTTALAWDSTPDSRLGPSLSISHTMGASAGTAVSDFIDTGQAQSLERQDVRTGRMTARLGYGFVSGTPELGFGLSDTDREITAGWTLAPIECKNGSVGFAVEGVRREGGHSWLS